MAQQVEEVSAEAHVNARSGVGAEAGVPANARSGVGAEAGVPAEVAANASVPVQGAPVVRGFVVDWMKVLKGVAVFLAFSLVGGVVLRFVYELSGEAGLLFWVVFVALAALGLIAYAEGKANYGPLKVVSVLLLVGCAVYFGLDRFALISWFESQRSRISVDNTLDAQSSYVEVLRDSQCVSRVGQGTNVLKVGQFLKVLDYTQGGLGGMLPGRGSGGVSGAKVENLTSIPGFSMVADLLLVQLPDSNGSFVLGGVSCLVDGMFVGEIIPRSRVQEIMKERSDVTVQERRQRPKYEVIRVVTGKGIKGDGAELGVRALEYGVELKSGDSVRLRPVGGDFSFCSLKHKWILHTTTTVIRNENMRSRPGTYLYVTAPKGKQLEVSILRR